MIWNAALEQQLVQAAAVSELPMDSEAFAAFYERSSRQLWGYLARVSGDRVLAEDLMQESFVRFLCSDQHYDGEVHARRYLFKIGSNLLKDHWRRPKTDSLEDTPERKMVSGREAESMEAEALLGPAMAKLRPRERELLWLAHAEGYTHTEIAEVLNVNAMSVRIMLFRARRKMAELLKGGGGA